MGIAFASLTTPNRTIFTFNPCQFFPTYEAIVIFSLCRYFSFMLIAIDPTGQVGGKRLSAYSTSAKINLTRSRVFLRFRLYWIPSTFPWAKQAGLTFSPFSLATHVWHYKFLTTPLADPCSFRFRFFSSLPWLTFTGTIFFPVPSGVVFSPAEIAFTDQLPSPPLIFMDLLMAGRAEAFQVGYIQSQFRVCLNRFDMMHNFRRPDNSVSFAPFAQWE